MYPDPNDPVAVSLEECEDLAAEEGAKNGWELSARFAARMLPQIFRPDSPVFQLTLPPEHQQKLERLVADLEIPIFTATDSLGWVYQFWQARKKDLINASEDWTAGIARCHPALHRGLYGQLSARQLPRGLVGGEAADRGRPENCPD
jgi:hypothetical protein